MTIPLLTGTVLAGDASLPLLVVGPSLGTSATSLWSRVAERLGDAFHVVGWNLPGHAGAPGAQPFNVADLAAGVLRFVGATLSTAGESEPGFFYAGDSVGGAVGLQLLLDAPQQVRAAALICTAGRIGTRIEWEERAETVRSRGISVLVEATRQRWFAPGFDAQEPELPRGLLSDLDETDAEAYAQVCDALAEFDVRDRLGEIGAPILALAGRHDVVTPISDLAAIAYGVPHGRLVVLGGVAHLAPAEAPDPVAALLREHFTQTPSSTPDQRYRAGMAVRRSVLGDAHVDRATAAVTDFTAEFQRFITEYAWGTIWTRPGLDRRSRSMITLTALIAGGHHDELAMHVRAALRNGLTVEEIREVLLQTAIYCGVPAANAAFRIAQDVLAAEQS